MHLFAFSFCEIHPAICCRCVQHCSKIKTADVSSCDTSSSTVARVFQPSPPSPVNLRNRVYAIVQELPRSKATRTLITDGTSRVHIMCKWRVRACKSWLRARFDSPADCTVQHTRFTNTASQKPHQTVHVSLKLSESPPFRSQAPLLLCYFADERNTANSHRWGVSLGEHAGRRLISRTTQPSRRTWLWFFANVTVPCLRARRWFKRCWLRLASASRFFFHQTRRVLDEPRRETMPEP